MDEAMHGAAPHEQLDPEFRMEVEAESGHLLRAKGDGGIDDPMDGDRRPGSRGSGRGPSRDGNGIRIPARGSRDRGGTFRRTLGICEAGRPGKFR
jgi:hypothetical protein